MGELTLPVGNEPAHEQPAIVAYAIVRASQVAPPGLTGPRGALVSTIQGRTGLAATLAAWISFWEAGSPTRADLLAHHAVATTACETGTCLPVRFGATFASAGDLLEVMERRAEALSRQLDHVGDRRELALTFEWRDPLLPVTDGSDAPDSRSAPATLTDHHTVVGRGTAYLRDRARRFAAQDAQVSRADSMARNLLGTLVPLCATDGAVKQRICPSTRIALSSAVLIDPARAATAVERVRQLVAGWPDVTLHVGGPWPPYTFCAIE